MISTGLGPNIVENEYSGQNNVYKWNEIIQNIMHFLFRIREFAISFPFGRLLNLAIRGAMAIKDAIHCIYSIFCNVRFESPA